MVGLHRVLRLRSYAAHARFLVDVSESPVAWLAACQVEIEQPYRSGPSHGVYDWRGRCVIVLETGQRQYDVYELSPELLRFPSDDAATEWNARFGRHAAIA